MIIKEVETKQEALMCNDFLNKLIKDEKKYDDNINDNISINNFYDNLYLNDNNKLFIAVDNDKSIGYIYLKITEPEKEAQLYKEVFIDAVYVEEEYRNKGIATNLIKKAKEYSKEMGAKKISINVIIKNEIAYKLYEKEGFEQFSVNLKQNL